MTKKQILSLKLGLAPITDRDILFVESAFEWVKKNTTLEFDYNNDSDLSKLPASVKLFVAKYHEIMEKDSAVSSESIEGLSQSFHNTDKEAQLWDAAYTLLGEWLKTGKVQFVSAVRKWY